MTQNIKIGLGDRAHLEMHATVDLEAAKRTFVLWSKLKFYDRQTDRQTDQNQYAPFGGIKNLPHLETLNGRLLSQIVKIDVIDHVVLSAS